jgi:hypothetical protein
MISLRRWLWIPFLAAALLGGCGEDQTAGDDLPPSKPIWVERSADDVYPQRGIRAQPVSSDVQHHVRLEWYANPEPDVSHYVIVRAPEDWGPRPGYVVADLQIGVDLEAGQAKYAWVDNGNGTDGAPLDLLAPDPESGFSRGYYWVLQASDTAGNRSQFSDVRYYRLINNPYDVSVGRDTANVYAASWSYQPNPDVLLSYYMLRVYGLAGGPDSVVWWQQAIRYESSETVYMDFSQSQAPLRAGQTYVCQINAISSRRTEAHADSLAGAAVFTTFVYQN